MPFIQYRTSPIRVQPRLAPVAAPHPAAEAITLPNQRPEREEAHGGDARAGLNHAPPAVANLLHHVAAGLEIGHDTEYRRQPAHRADCEERVGRDLGGAGHGHAPEDEEGEGSEGNVGDRVCEAEAERGDVEVAVPGAGGGEGDGAGDVDDDEGYDPDCGRDDGEGVDYYALPDVVRAEDAEHEEGEGDFDCDYGEEVHAVAPAGHLGSVREVQGR